MDSLHSSLNYVSLWLFRSVLSNRSYIDRIFKLAPHLESILFFLNEYYTFKLVKNLDIACIQIGTKFNIDEKSANTAIDEVLNTLEEMVLQKIGIKIEWKDFKYYEAVIKHGSYEIFRSAVEKELQESVGNKSIRVLSVTPGSRCDCVEAPFYAAFPLMKYALGKDAVVEYLPNNELEGVSFQSTIYKTLPISVESIKGIGNAEHTELKDWKDIFRDSIKTGSTSLRTMLLKNYNGIILKQVLGPAIELTSDLMEQREGKTAIYLISRQDKEYPPIAQFSIDSKMKISELLNLLSIVNGLIELKVSSRSIVEITKIKSVGLWKPLKKKKWEKMKDDKRWREAEGDKDVVLLNDLSLTLGYCKRTFGGILELHLLVENENQ